MCTARKCYTNSVSETALRFNPALRWHCRQMHAGSTELVRIGPSGVVQLANGDCAIQWVQA